MSLVEMAQKNSPVEGENKLVFSLSQEEDGEEAEE